MEPFVNSVADRSAGLDCMAMAESGTSRNPLWRISQLFPSADTYAERANECRRIAQLSSPWSQSYLELAAKYEQLAKDAEYERLGQVTWRLLERWRGAHRARGQRS